MRLSRLHFIPLLMSMVVCDEQKGLSYKKDCMTGEKLKSNTNRFYWEKTP
jgi:hypothetical protein